MINYIIGLLCLILGSIQDIKKREVEDYIWLAMVGFGFLYHLFLTLKFGNISFLILFFESLFISFILGYFMFLLGSGGADGKALIGIGALVPSMKMPIYSSIFKVLSLLNFPTFPILVFINSLFLIIFYPIVIFLRNLRRGKPRNLKELLLMFVAEKMRYEEIKKEKRIILGKDEEVEIFKHGEEALNYNGYKDDDLLWASPAIPFIFIILLSYILTPYMGDIIIAKLLEFLGI
ncbi:Peptidase A24B, FlaK domain protein [Methanocaldococcus infernus ME]|uniref:Peptidase A24B, FlaK domain protein n=1 Tax=Methanocaldococcus infernus (strain DSM 11812 / JCM 15783 / ME) TaxID=573063 RepID=D5VSA0_METIM|nr:preflagellin peptidase FlaK [Methanocaldococcus infernus]ADG13453.1 Peptidase A24B, FlaK domain protein [Methanocaldococcus infernus ME]